MKKVRFVSSLVTPLAAVLIAGCTGGGGGTGGDNNDAGGAPNDPPPPASDHPACVISADCPAGEHCDLGECIQDCNTDMACGGSQRCTPRARCVEPGSPDTDPPPSPHYSGAVSAAPTSASLTEADKTFSVQLSTASSDPVRYRIELSAPHLSIGQVRGEFSKTTTLVFTVNTAAFKGRDVPGTITIHTTLGDVVVTAPIHVGVTGSYQGSLRFDGGPTSLGETRIGLDLLEKSGNVSMHIDPKKSLLFPTMPAGDVTGAGSFTVSDGVDVTVSQRIPSAFGDSRNHFGRDVGLKTRFKLHAATRGNLEGTFEMTTYALFSTPTTLTGTVSLEYVPPGPTGGDPDFRVLDAPSMPSAPSKDLFLSPSDVFGWSDPSCDHIVCGVAGCTSASSVAAAMSTAEATYAQPLNNAVKTRAGDAPFNGIAADCSAALGAKSLSDWKGGCSLVVPLACALPIAAKRSTADTATAQKFGDLYAEMLAPGLLVAKNEVVNALSDSFTSDGIAKEVSHYNNAQQALAPLARWALQPSVAEYLRSISPEGARGDGSATAGGDAYPAGRALADLLYTSSVIDGERARIDAANAGSDPKLATAAQTRALLGFLETAMLSEIVSSWGVSVPHGITVKFTGVLNPLDQGFSALVNGANAFGVPSGFVPFVYRPDDVSKTNFEQMLGMAQPAISAEEISETTFVNNKRTYELNAKDLNAQLSSVRSQYDLRLKTICGASFDPDAITGPDDWNKCGAGNAGDVGAMLLDVEAALARVRAAQGRIEGAKEKIAIDTKALSDTQHVHEETLNFVSATGDQLSQLDIAEGVISAEEKFLDMAAQSSVGNFGAPAAMAGFASLLELEKAGLESEKQQLQTAQTMRFEAATAQIELINGMANIQKETIDVVQLGVDMQQDLIGVVQTEARVRSSVEEAKAIYDERARVLDLVDHDPSNDPSYRLLRDQEALTVLADRAEAQKQLYLVGQALQYEINQHIPAIDGAVLNAHNTASLKGLAACMSTIVNAQRIAFGIPQDYATTVSLRQMLGITGPRTDAVTGEVLSEGQQFRELLLRNANLDGQGGVGITFATDLMPKNGLWSSNVCNDRVSTMQAQLVGDFLGDNQAEVTLSLTGGAVMRQCGSDSVESWSFGAIGASSSASVAVIQAGVNTFGDAPPNSSLAGQSVARASWKLAIPGASAAPTNSDIDLTHVDDVVLKIAHKALPQKTAPLSIDLSCLATIGK